MMPSAFSNLLMVTRLVILLCWLTCSSFVGVIVEYICSISEPIDVSKEILTYGTLSSCGVFGGRGPMWHWHDIVTTTRNGICRILK